MRRCTSVNICDTLLQLPYNNLEDGIYKIVLDFLSNTVSLTLSAEQGKVFLPLSGLNESFYYECRLYDVDGLLQKIDDVYDTFAFTTCLNRAF